MQLSGTTRYTASGVGSRLQQLVSCISSGYTSAMYPPLKIQYNDISMSRVLPAKLQRADAPQRDDTPNFLQSRRHHGVAKGGGVNSPFPPWVTTRSCDI